MNTEMMDALQALAADKGISVDTLFAALADALESAYKRMPDAYEYAWVTIDPESMDIKVYAQELDEDGEPSGDEFDVTPDNFGRIAAQTAKQVMMQRIREAERELKYEEYAGREGDIVTGIIQQSDSRYTLLDLGRVEALLPQAEQVANERPDSNARIKAYIVEVRKTAKGPQIVVSRTHPGLIKRLFELEVPEIADGIVEIKACAREPGHRTKIAVWSNDSNVDPVGACVGARGARVRMVVNELRGEKIDIVPFSEESEDFVMKALSPAKVKEVRIDENTGTAEVIVPDYQLSLAIGKEGQNARLTARLTGWRVDIKSETQLAEEEAYGDVDWAEGEWIVDAESGEQMWQPAGGGPAISADQWAQMSAEDDDAGAGDAEAAGADDAGAGDAEAAGADDAGAGDAEAAGADDAGAGDAEAAGADDAGAGDAEAAGADDAGAGDAAAAGADDAGDAEAAGADDAGDAAAAGADDAGDAEAAGADDAGDAAAEAAGADDAGDAAAAGADDVGDAAAAGADDVGDAAAEAAGDDEVAEDETDLSHDVSPAAAAADEAVPAGTDASSEAPGEDADDSASDEEGGDA